MNKKVLLAAFLGTLVEVYDFTVFPFFIPILSEVFFSSSERGSAFNFIILAYVISYFVKPLSALIYGYLIDRLGRKRVFLFNTILMTIATSAIALLPLSLMNKQHGILLVICRILQGIAISGEFSSAIIMAVEQGKVGSAIHGCIAFIGGSMGLFLANLSALIILYIIPHEQIISFGWRIPFLIGTLGCICLLFIRLNLKWDFIINTNNKNNNFKSLFKNYKKELWSVFIVSSLSASAFYVTFVFLPTILSSLLEIHTHQNAILITLSALILYLMCLPLCGLLADRIGVLRQIWIAAILYLLFSYMVFSAVPQLDFSRCIIALLFFSIIQALLNSALPAFIVSRFELNQRGKALGVSYNLSLALFGGWLPYVMTKFDNYLNPGIPISVCAILCLISINPKEIKYGYLRSKLVN